MDFKHIFVALVLQIVLMCSLSAAVTQTQLEDFTAAVKKISSDLYQNCARNFWGNLVISPYSAANAIVLLSQAGNGSAFDQLKSSIKFNGSESDLLDEYVAYHQSLTGSAEKSVMIVANKLYVQEGYHVNPKFTEVATQQLQSGVRMIDFRNATASAKIINGFVQEKTQNKTGDIIVPAAWSPTAQILLMNTIYLKFSFDKVYQTMVVNVSDRFYTHNANPNAVKQYDNITYVVFENGRFNYAELNDSLKAQALEIRFADSKFSLLLILPTYKSGLSNLERDMKNYDLTTILDRMRPETVTVEIPTFKMKFHTGLKNIAKNMKIPSFFEENLTKLLINDTSTPVSDVLLTTVFELEAGKKPDEKTNNFLSSLSKLYTSDQNYSFVANRPFLYYVYDRKLKTAVVSGRLKEFQERKREEAALKGYDKANASIVFVFNQRPSEFQSNSIPPH